MGDIAVIGTTDDRLLDGALRWCAATGASVITASSADAVRREWRDAAVVLVGEDLVRDVAGTSAPRRDHVLVLARDPDAMWREAVAMGASGVFAPDDDTGALAAIGAALDGRVEGCTVSVVGGSGGVGATTFAAALGLAGAHRGHDAVLLDADPGGAGVDLVLGSERAVGLRWPELSSVDGHLSGESLADVLPRHDGLATVSWPVSVIDPVVPPTAQAVWSAATRAFDLVVADTPRTAQTGWPATLLAGSVLTVVVVAEDLPGVAAARRVVARVRTLCGSVAVVSVVRRGGLGSAAVEDALGVPVISRTRPARRLSTAIDHGRGPRRSRSLRRASADVLDLIGLDAGGRS